MTGDQEMPNLFMAMPLAVALVAGSISGPAKADDKPSWGCGYSSNGDKAELDARARNIGLRRVLEQYRARWDAAHMRAQCEAFAAGQPHEIGCLDGRRNWDEIVAMVPGDLWSMSAGQLRPVYLKMQEEDDGYKAALEYCGSVGAIDRKWTR